MGHASVETNQRFYGRRNAVYSGFGVRPAFEDMPEVLLDSQEKMELARKRDPARSKSR